MPLLDHFHPPLLGRRHWESFHGTWAVELMGVLNAGVLPEGYFAEAQMHVGGLVEVDVPTFEETNQGSSKHQGNGGVATQTWAPPATIMAMPAVFPDDIEVQVFRASGGATLVAAVELVSPGNKDRDDTRLAFANKCASYLQAGIGLVVVDVVTERSANLHDELVNLLGHGEQFAFPGAVPLYAAAYRPRRRKTGDQIEVWPYPLVLGQTLPTVPLALRGGPTVPLDLETAYVAACQRGRIPQ